MACEFSGIVRDAFIARGHDAVSCDLINSERPGPHIIGLVEDVLTNKEYGRFDLMIAHPPCRYLAVSGARYWAQRVHEQRRAAIFFMFLVKAPVERIAVENPIGIMSRAYRKPDQIIQPWEYGHPESKKTCLWLKGLPKLRPTNILPLPASGHWENQTPSGQNRLGPSPTRAQDRSRTYQGIADAMASQWG